MVGTVSERTNRTRKWPPNGILSYGKNAKTHANRRLELKKQQEIKTK